MRVRLTATRSIRAYECFVLSCSSSPYLWLKRRGYQKTDFSLNVFFAFFAFYLGKSQEMISKEKINPKTKSKKPHSRSFNLFFSSIPSHKQSRLLLKKIFLYEKIALYHHTDEQKFLKLKDNHLTQVSAYLTSRSFF